MTTGQAWKEPAHFACAPNETPEPSDHPADLAADERAALREVWHALSACPCGCVPLHSLDSAMQSRVIAAFEKLLGKATP